MQALMRESDWGEGKEGEEFKEDEEGRMNRERRKEGGGAS